MMLYKYQRINDYSFEGLKQKNLWIADPTSFNDPFELRLIELSDEEIKNVKGLDKVRNENSAFVKLSDKDFFEKVRNELQNQFSKLRVICFTEKNDNLLMWAHYAGDHKGICLGFNISDTNKEGVYKIDYDDDYPKIDLEKIWHKDGTAKILFTKSRHWSYENEWRRLHIEPATPFGKYPGELTEIILGARISEENEKRLREMFDKTSVVIKKASLHPSRYELIIK